MSRSLKKGPFIEPKLLEKIEKMNTAGDKKVIRGGGRYDPGSRLTATGRQYASPDTRAEDLGFRCASDP